MSNEPEFLPENNWISIKESGLPDSDGECVVCNENRPFNFYISYYCSYLKEFGVYLIGCTRLTDGISFNATHYMKLKIPVKGEKIKDEH